MNFKNKIAIKIFSGLIVLFTIPKIALSQEANAAFVMSSVGTIQNTSNNSMALTFSSNLACLNIQNGTSILNSEAGTGLFEINCKLDVKYNSLGIQLSPNPVNAISKLKFLNKPPLNENFAITIWSTEGFKLLNFKANGEEIFKGKNVDFSSLISGSFVIQVESSNYIDAIKFVKAK